MNQLDEDKSCPMQADKEPKIRPLEELLKLLRREFPFYHNDTYHAVDGFLNHDGRFTEAVYESAILNLARRLIVHTQYIAKKSAKTVDPETVKESLYRTFRVQSLDAPDQLVNLVYECYKYSLKKLPNGTKNSVKKNSRSNNSNCYICGVALTYADPNLDTFHEAEHILPRSLGGSNFHSNLKGACKRCNNFKDSRINGADLHYEYMVYPFTEIGPKKLRDYHLFAARLFNNHACTECGRPAELAGELEVFQISDSDSWNLFNTMLLCVQCASKLTAN